MGGEGRGGVADGTVTAAGGGGGGGGADLSTPQPIAAAHLSQYGYGIHFSDEKRISLQLFEISRFQFNFHHDYTGYSFNL